jgi:hypothetical protein
MVVCEREEEDVSNDGKSKTLGSDIGSGRRDRDQMLIYRSVGSRGRSVHVNRVSSANTFKNEK